jgi:hypothetical protein
MNSQNEESLNKNTFRQWMLLLGMILLIIASLGYEIPQGRTLVDIVRENDSLTPILNPSGDFYSLFRLLIFCISFYFGFLKYKEREFDIVFLFVVLGIIFNPFFTFHFNYTFSTMLDLSAAGVFGYFAYKEYRKIRNNHEEYSVSKNISYDAITNAAKNNKTLDHQAIDINNNTKRFTKLSWKVLLPLGLALWLGGKFIGGVFGVTFSTMGTVTFITGIVSFARRKNKIKS